MHCVQDVLILLDLIGTSDTTFVNWFSKTKRLYDRLRDIGIVCYLLCQCFSIQRGAVVVLWLR